MKKNIVLLSALLLIIGLVGCTDVGTPHEHIFKEEWETNETQHWHNAVCEHTDLVKNLENHNFGNDNICDVCGYEKSIPAVQHEHTFSDSWSKDELNHWHESTCEHTDLSKDLGSHEYGDDNICDTCGYVKPAPAHEHTFSSDWNKDETNHWHESTCEHTDLVKDLAEHNFGDDNICDTCGYVKPAPAHEHTFSSDWSNDESKHWHASTCEHTDLVKDLAEHNFGDDNICDTCGYVKPAPAHEHTFSSDWSNDESKHWHASTCGHNLVENLANHTYGENNICTVCGFKKIEKHTITYVGWPEGIENINPKEFIRTDEFTFDGTAISEKEGFSNVKFIVDSKEVTSLEGFDKDVIVNVSYDAVITKMTVDPNDGYNDSFTIDLPYWTIPSTLISDYTRSFHSFVGWFNDEGVEIDINERWTNLDEDYKVTAKWKFEVVDKYAENLDEFKSSIIIEAAKVIGERAVFATLIGRLDRYTNTGKEELMEGIHSKEEADEIYDKYCKMLNEEAFMLLHPELSILFTNAFTQKMQQTTDVNKMQMISTYFTSHQTFGEKGDSIADIVSSYQVALQGLLAL